MCSMLHSLTLCSGVCYAGDIWSFANSVYIYKAGYAAYLRLFTFPLGLLQVKSRTVHCCVRCGIYPSIPGNTWLAWRRSSKVLRLTKWEPRTMLEHKWISATLSSVPPDHRVSCEPPLTAEPLFFNSPLYLNHSVEAVWPVFHSHSSAGVCRYAAPQIKTSMKVKS